MSSPIRTPFDFHSTAEQILEDVDLSGTRAIVTGAASGIGVETARALAGARAEVTLAARDTARAAEVAADITHTTGNDHILEQLKDTMPVKTPEQGAATSVLVAASPLLEGVAGRYFEDANEAEVVSERGARGVAGYALDPANADRLWDVSLKLIGA